MKQTRRILTVLMILAILMLGSSIAASANETLTLPAALQVVDVEAFYGSSSIQQVILPEGITEIRARAFANSTLSEINLPDSLTFIDPSAFDGPDKVTVTANEGTYAYDWAVAYGYISLNLTIRSLSSNVSNATIGELITWTADVEGGTEEYNYQYTVYNGKNIVMTTGYSDSASFSYSPTSVGQYYVRVMVDDGEDSVNLKTESAVEVTRTDLRITSINTSAESAMLGDTVYWTVKTIGGESGLTFNYTLKRDEILVDSLSNSQNNFFSSILDEKGTYCLYVSVTDKNGALADAQSAPVDVGNSVVQIIEITLNSTMPTVSGEELVWTVNATEGKPPYSYQYTLRDQTGEVYSETSESNTFRYTDTIENHVYTLYAVCVDADGKQDQVSATPVQVYAIEEVTATSPTVQLSISAGTLSETEADASVISIQSLPLAVQNAENANQYTLLLEANQGGQWNTLWQQTFDSSITQNTIPEMVFADITEQTLCRLTASAMALRPGESKSYYFHIKPVVNDYTLLVDGKTSAVWQRSVDDEGERTFSIASAQPWTVSEKPDWVTVIEGTDSLTVRMSYNAEVFGNRSGDVIITNQIQTATISLFQGHGNSAPELTVSKVELFTDPNHPTEMPYGGFIVEIQKNGNNYSCLQVAEKESGDYRRATRRAVCRNSQSFCTLGS